MARTHIHLYLNYEACFRPLSDKDLGELVRAWLHYANTGEEKELQGMGKFIYPLIVSNTQREFDNYDEACRKKKEAAEKRWARIREKQLRDAWISKEEEDE